MTQDNTNQDTTAQAYIPQLKLYNTLSNQKETFEPLHPPLVGMYVCGPTVYNDAHIGNARPAVFFDVVYRYLAYLGYQVRYVRNITDVGHLRDNEEDRISKQAKLQQLEPMEVVHFYTRKYHQVMDALNVKRPNIEPTATGHIVEQIEIIQKILAAGFAYISEGSVYFDVPAYHQTYKYGELSGRVMDELLQNTRELEGQDEKRNPADFALWKKASPEHLMRWNSPWSVGFPGWHLECSVMSTKYLGEVFDIHGGGMDLMFPHHECEIAQAKAVTGKSPVKYWLHNNMITVNGVKMGKSPRLQWNDEAIAQLKKAEVPEDLIEAVLKLNQPQTDEFEKKLKEEKFFRDLEGEKYLNTLKENAKEFVNFITIEDIFLGKNPILEKPFSPMTIRFFILQAHYRSTLDFSNKALLDAQKSYKGFINALNNLQKLVYQGNENAKLDEKLDKQIQGFCDNAFRGMNDDLNTAMALGQLANMVKKINSFYTHPDSLATISEATFQRMKETFVVFVQDIFGLTEEKVQNQEGFIKGLLDIYKDAKATKEYDKVDKIRAYFKECGLIIKDLKNGVDWAYEE
jgi:cysteinyl-tRNA synthetase